MGYNQRNAKVDDNQKPIVKALRRIGAKVWHVHTIKKFYDIQVAFRGQLFAIEIKDGAKFPNYYIELTKEEKRTYLEKQLSEGEKECMEAMQSAGVPYHIVSSIDEAIALINTAIQK